MGLTPYLAATIADAGPLAEEVFRATDSDVLCPAECFHATMLTVLRYATETNLPKG